MKKRKPSSLQTRLQLRVKPLALAAQLCLLGAPWASAFASGVLPQGMNVVSGSAVAAQAGNALTLTTGANTVLNWQSFSIGAQNSVVFQQPSASSQVLNRVTGQDPSHIFGTLQSNGRVWLINPNGVLFGAGARIDVGGLVASTLNIDNDDFLAGRHVLRGVTGSSATVVNQGQITTPYGGQVLLVGSGVRNEGAISVPGGSAMLLAGERVELLDTATPFMSVKGIVAGGVVTNTGSVSAQRIDVHGAAVNQSGSLLAAGIQQDEHGQIVLRAPGNVVLAAGSETSAPGGRIDITSEAGTLDVAGRVQADASSNLGNGGRIMLWGEKQMNFSGEATARGGAQGGDGGFIETSGRRVSILEGASIDTAAPHGKTGTWLIDPVDFTIAASGGDMTGAQLGAMLDLNNVTIQSSSGSSGTDGDIHVADQVSWSNGNSLTLMAYRNINIGVDSAAGLTSNGGGLVLVAGGVTLLGGNYSPGGGYIDLGGGTLTLSSGDLVMQGFSALRNLKVESSLGTPKLWIGSGSVVEWDRITLGLQVEISGGVQLNVSNGLNFDGGEVIIRPLSGMGTTIEFLGAGEQLIGGIGSIRAIGGDCSSGACGPVRLQSAASLRVGAGANVLAEEGTSVSLSGLVRNDGWIESQYGANVSITAHDGIAFVNSGVLNSVFNFSIDSPSGTPWINENRFEVAAGAVANSGAVIVTGTGSITAYENASINFQSSLELQPNASLMLFDSAGLTVHGLFTNAGTVQLDARSIQLLGGYRQDVGSLVLGTPGKQTAAWLSGLVNVNEVVITGGTTLTTNLLFGHWVGDPLSYGTVNFTGDLTLLADSKMQVHVGGTTPGVGHDAISVGGVAALGGTLEVKQFGSYVPAGGETYSYLTYGSRIGDFSAIDFVAPTSDWGLTYAAAPGGATLSASPASSPPPPPSPPAETGGAIDVDRQVFASAGAATRNTQLWPAATLGETELPDAPATPGAASLRYSGTSSAILDTVASSGAVPSPAPSPRNADGGPTPAPQPLPSHRFLVSDLSNVYFRVLPLADMETGAINGVLSARRDYKKALFADAIRQLEQRPSLPDLPGCVNAAASASGNCLPVLADASSSGEAKPSADKPAERIPASASVPQIARKFAVVIGVNRYDDRRIPQLTGAVPDASALQGLLSEQLGYEAVLLGNPSKTELFAALDQVAAQLSENDSLLIYYAGHGEMVDSTGMGYWLPRDASASDPKGWVSNADINRVLAASKSRQMVVIADSCYSGRFVSDTRGGEAGAATRIEDLLQRRAVTMMSSGGDEPVADAGKDGHSVFTWHLMEKMRDVQGWTSGASVHDAVRTRVERELPQTPQYGAAAGAGHEQGADYVFERRAAPGASAARLIR